MGHELRRVLNESPTKLDVDRDRPLREEDRGTVTSPTGHPGSSHHRGGRRCRRPGARRGRQGDRRQAGRAAAGARAMLAGGHVLLEDFPGLGKTLAARSFAQALGLDFTGRSSPPTCCPPTSPARSSTTSAPRVRVPRGPVFTGLLLADEINRTPPKTQAALLEAMQEQQVTVEGETFPLAEPVPRAGDRQPDRVRRHLPAARGPARPVPAAGRLRLPVADEEYDVSTPGGAPPGGGRARRGRRRGRAARMQAAVETVGVDESSAATAWRSPRPPATTATRSPARRRAARSAWCSRPARSRCSAAATTSSPRTSRWSPARCSRTASRCVPSSG